MQPNGRRELLISRAWIQVVLLVVLCGFFILGLLAYRTYMAGPPVPVRVVDQQQRSASSDEATRPTIEDFRTNRYDARTGTLTLTPTQVMAFRRLVSHYSRFFSNPTTEHGLRPNAITDPTRLRQLTAFFAWTAWAASTNRPGHDYSYTNNWPPEPRVDNKPTANVVVLAVLSLIALLGGIGLLFGAFGRWGRSLGWHGREQSTLSFRSPGDIVLTPSQRATAGSSSSWPRCSRCSRPSVPPPSTTAPDLAGFFGLDIAQILVLCGHPHSANYADGMTMPMCWLVARADWVGSV